MKPHELIAALVQRSGKSTLLVAREMRNARFQGTLHKFAAGLVASPARRTAETIATYFDIPVDALYDPAVSSRVARERGLVRAPSAIPQRVEAPAPPAYLVKSAVRLTRLAPDIEKRLRGLTDLQRHGLETVMRAYLDTLTPASAKENSVRAL